MRIWKVTKIVIVPSGYQWEKSELIEFYLEKQITKGALLSREQQFSSDLCTKTTIFYWRSRACYKAFLAIPEVKRELKRLKERDAGNNISATFEQESVEVEGY